VLTESAGVVSVQITTVLLRPPRNKNLGRTITAGGVSCQCSDLPKPVAAGYRCGGDVVVPCQGDRERFWAPEAIPAEGVPNLGSKLSETEPNSATLDRANPAGSTWAEPKSQAGGRAVAGSNPVSPDLAKRLQNQPFWDLSERFEESRWGPIGVGTSSVPYRSADEVGGTARPGGGR
jgi:hypothetical protein